MKRKSIQFKRGSDDQKHQKKLQEKSNEMNEKSEEIENLKSEIRNDQTSTASEEEELKTQYEKLKQFANDVEGLMSNLRLSSDGGKSMWVSRKSLENILAENGACMNCSTSEDCREKLRSTLKELEELKIEHEKLKKRFRDKGFDV